MSKTALQLVGELLLLIDKKMRKEIERGATSISITLKGRYPKKKRGSR